MIRRSHAMALGCLALALGGCGGDSDEERPTTTAARTQTATTTTAALSEQEARERARDQLAQWSDKLVDTLTLIGERQRAADAGEREPYYKADGKLQPLFNQMTRWGTDAERVSGGFPQARLRDALVADGQAWASWAEAVFDPASLIGAKRGIPSTLSEAALAAHLAAYRAAEKRPPQSFREAGERIGVPAQG